MTEAQKAKAEALAELLAASIDLAKEQGTKDEAIAAAIAVILFKLGGNSRQIDLITEAAKAYLTH